jgi:hypothetical protein
MATKMVSSGNQKAHIKSLEKLIEEALEIIIAFGVPLEGLTPRRKVKMAKAFLAVAAMKPGLKWSTVKSNDDGHRLRSREVIKWMNAHLGENISDGSYDDIRRKDLIFLVEAGVVIGGAQRDDAKTNDGTRANALAPAFVRQTRMGSGACEGDEKPHKTD